MTVNKTAEAMRKYREDTPVGQFRVRFIYTLGGVPVYGEWYRISEVLENNGVMFANLNKHMRVSSMELEMVQQPPRKGRK